MIGPELHRPLTRHESDTLSEHLATTPAAMPYHEAHGFLTAVVSAPTTFQPSQWQRVLLGEGAFVSHEHAERIFGLVMRFYNGIVSSLEARQRITPAEPDDVPWSTGYLKCVRMDKVWMADEHQLKQLYPMAVLSGALDLVGKPDAAGEIITDPAPQLHRCRQALESSVHEINRHWTARRRAGMAPPTRAPKVGRNESCPCGSGTKYKKCCALKEA
ncbi:MAG: UPF0149 family protein [Kofleriaceae bacterium]